MIACCALLTWLAWHRPPHLVLVFPLVLGHFFLFCNIFRVGTRSELIWSAVFMLNATVWFTSDRFSWTAVMLSQTPVTLAVILRAILSPDYHGIGCRWLNPKLESWLNQTE